VGRTVKVSSRVRDGLEQAGVMIHYIPHGWELKPDTKDGIDYSRRGGIAGIAEQWNFYLDRLVADIDGSEYQASAEDVGNILNEIIAYEFFHWDGGCRPEDYKKNCFNADFAPRNGKESMIDLGRNDILVEFVVFLVRVPTRSELNPPVLRPNPD